MHARTPSVYFREPWELPRTEVVGGFARAPRVYVYTNHGKIGSRTAQVIYPTGEGEGGRFKGYLRGNTNTNRKARI